jgi:hypothetical protein
LSSSARIRAHLFSFFHSLPLLGGRAADARVRAGCLKALGQELFGGLCSPAASAAPQSAD